MITRPRFCQIFIFIREIFERKIKNSKDHFWVFYNDSLGINHNSYDGCLQFWTKSWPTGEKCDFKNITSDMDRIKKILQVINEGGGSFEAFINGSFQSEWLSMKFLDFWMDCGLDHWDYVGWLWFYWDRFYISGWFLFRNYWKYYDRWIKDLCFVW